MSHTCHARGCEVPVKPVLLMCPRHWRRIPAAIQAAVYANYRSGQCSDMKPSREWHDAASAAIAYVATLEGKGVTKNEAKALAKYEREFLVTKTMKRLGVDRATVEKALEQ